MTQFRVAVVQAGALPFDSKSSLEKACTLATKAAEQDAKLVVFPEAFVSAKTRLARRNLSDPIPHPLVATLLYTHPPTMERIKMAQEWKEIQKLK